MLFASLYRSLFALVERELTEREAESTIKVVKQGLNAVLESSTDFFAPFVGSIQVSGTCAEHFKSKQTPLFFSAK